MSCHYCTVYVEQGISQGWGNARSSPIVQGVHNVSLVLGMEATRDLEEETFNGVRASGKYVGKWIALSSCT
jgi:hypothetical protein